MQSVDFLTEVGASVTNNTVKKSVKKITDED